MGIKKVCACNENPCKCAKKAENAKAAIVAANEMLAKYGGKVETTINEDGSITTTYYPLSPKK